MNTLLRAVSHCYGRHPLADAGGVWENGALSF